MSSYQGFQAASQGWSPRGVLGSWAPLTSRDWCWRRPQHYLRHVGLRSSQSCSATLPMPEIQAGWWQGWLSCICWRGWDCGGVRCCSLCERWQREDLHRASRGRSLCYFCCFLEKFVQLQESRWFSTPPPPTPPFSLFITRWKCSLGVQIHPSLMPFCFEMNLLGSQEVCSGPLLGPETSFGCHFPGQHHRKCWT